MKKILFIVLLFAFVACIENDLPYPKVVGKITAFEVEGQTDCKIDEENLTVEIVLQEDVDISNVKLKVFEVSKDAVVSPDIKSPINLSQPVQYTLTTYQEYVWTISASQSIERYFKVKNQIGEAKIDVQARTVTVAVAKSQDLKNITILEAKIGPKGYTVMPNLLEIKDFSKNVEVVLSNNKGKQEKWTIIFEQSEQSILTGEANAFAKYAFVKGQFQEGTGTPSFEYKKVDDKEWIKVADEKVKISGGEFEGEITDLEPETEYVYRSFVGKLMGEEKSFTTEKTLQVENSSFDEWTKSGKSWYANKDLSATYFWWDSGNAGANTNPFAETNPTSPEGSIVVKGKAAKLACTSVFSFFAAGSIYTGKYVETVGTSGAQLDFGRPFKGRPKALKGYYRYSPGTINKTGGSYSYLSGKTDTCHIYALLTDWNAPFRINTSAGKFIDREKDPGIIAKCELASGSKSDKYIEFNLPFVYKDLKRIPKYIVIVASASKYGDYFTGSESSVLYIDEFELVY